MLYNYIPGLENKFSGFNQQSFSSREIIDFIDFHFNENTLILKDYTVKTACLLKHEDKQTIFYNPYQSESHLVLTIGHEIGHIFLGHKGESHFNMFAKRGKEKDAGIIGFLFWIPTINLERIKKYGQLGIEELYQYIHNCDLTINETIKLCMARLRIYNAFNRIISKGGYYENFN